MRVNNSSPLTMSTPSFDAHNNDRSADASRDHPRKHPSRGPANYERTPSGGVVVEPSFDAEENNHYGNPKLAGNRHSDWQQRGPSGEKEVPSDSRRSAASSDGGAMKRGGHRRDLSAHFYEATSLSGETKEHQGEVHHGDTAYGRREEAPPTISPAAGQKHRRVFSGDGSNPPQAHRRINSIGASASVKRQYKQHQRVDSAGLDVLTAAADASREELAAAAGHRARDARNPWEPPAGGSSRRSPIEMSTYDYSAMNAPPHRSRHSYPPGGPHVPPGYMSSPIGPHMGPPPSYPPPPYSSSASYYHPPPHGFPRGYPPPPMGYPVQYSVGPDPYMKHAPLGPPPQSAPEHAGGNAPPSAAAGEQRVAPERGSNSAMTPPPPVPPSHWRGHSGTHQGVQTFVTAIGVGDGARTMHPSHNRGASVTERPGGHHRKLSSFSSIVGPLSSLFQAPDPSEHPLKRHHRSTSSSVSFLQGFDVGLESSDATFLQNLQASNAVGEPPSSENKEAPDRSGADDEGDDSDSDTNNKLAPGGTSKRVRRKCTVGGCANRVVQGGLCISHGAKRKTCKHPGCNKNVKKAGLCSTHGPARRRCDADGCSKVAVQGGRCIAHGAKKKLCSVPSCSKQAILAGMCKKHHDQDRSNDKLTQSPLQCKPVDDDDNSRQLSSAPAPAAPRGGGPARRKANHIRGLSIFQDLTADAVGTLLSDEVAINGNGQPRRPSPPATDQQPSRHHPSYSRDFGNTGMY
jgi:hypothetical protein